MNPLATIITTNKLKHDFRFTLLAAESFKKFTVPEKWKRTPFPEAKLVKPSLRAPRTSNVQAGSDTKRARNLVAARNRLCNENVQPPHLDSHSRNPAIEKRDWIGIQIQATTVSLEKNELLLYSVEDHGVFQ